LGRNRCVDFRDFEYYFLVNGAADNDLDLVFYRAVTISEWRSDFGSRDLSAG
jgi:hypothetical protein